MTGGASLWLAPVHRLCRGVSKLSEFHTRVAVGKVKTKEVTLRDLPKFSGKATMSLGQKRLPGHYRKTAEVAPENVACYYSLRRACMGKLPRSLSGYISRKAEFRLWDVNCFRLQPCLATSVFGGAKKEIQTAVTWYLKSLIEKNLRSPSLPSAVSKYEHQANPNLNYYRHRFLWRLESKGEPNYAQCSKGA